jgi:hypothetical protein
VPPVVTIVRVAPNGDALFSGTAEGGSKVEILERTAVLSSSQATATGAFSVTLNKALAVGEHELSVRATSANGASQLLSDARVAVTVPANPADGARVVLNRPGAAPQVLQAAQAQATTPATPASPPAAVAGAAPTPATTAPPAAIATAPSAAPAVTAAAAPPRAPPPAAAVAAGATEARAVGAGSGQAAPSVPPAAVLEPNTAAPLAAAPPNQRGMAVPTDDAGRRALIAELQQSRAKGLLVPEIPPEMVKGETKKVRVTLSRGKAGADVLIDGIAIDTGSSSTVTVVPLSGDLLANTTVIPFSGEFVRVKLVGGKAFTVGEAIDEKMDFGRRDTGEWIFYVTPELDGEHELQIVVYLYTQGGFAPDPVATFTHPIRVYVPFPMQIAEIWEHGPKEFVLVFVAGLLSLMAFGWWEAWKKARATWKRARVVPAPANDGTS